MKAKNKFSLEMIARGLLIVAAGLSAYLAWLAFNTTGGVSGCGEGAACNNVLASQWAKVFGVPVAILGCITYLTAAFFGSLKGSAIPARLGLLLLIPAVAAWFIGLQFFVIGSFCVWCCAAHALATTGAIILISRACELPRRPWFLACGGVAAAVAAFVSVQLIDSAEEQATQASVANVYEFGTAADPSGKMQNEIRVLGGEVTFKLDELPLLGRVGAEQVVIALTDYTCPHCRDLQAVLAAASADLDEGVAILMLPATRKGTESAAIHSLMLALWKADPHRHSLLEKKLVDGQVDATAKAVEAEAIRIVGGHQLAEARTKYATWISDQIANTRRLQDANFEETGKRTLPQVIVGSEITFGTHTDPGFYVGLVNETFGLPKSANHKAVTQSFSPQERDVIVRLNGLSPGTSAPFKVTFLNSSESPLEISWMRLPAGVTLETFTQGDIDPGASAELSLTLKVPEATPAGTIEYPGTVNTTSGHSPIGFRVLATVANDLAQ